MLPQKTLLTGFIRFFIFSFLYFSQSPTAFAGDGALIVLKDGREAAIRDGYKILMDAMRKRKKGQAGKSQVIEINLDGSSLFIDASQIAVLCKQPCKSFEMLRSKK